MNSQGMDREKIALDHIDQALTACLARAASFTMTAAAAMAALSFQEQEELLRRAEAHHILPLLDTRLAALGLREAIAPPLTARLRRAVLETEAINFGRLVQLDTILKAFADAGIELILLKGIHLALFFYPEATERTMGDFDLLIHPGDIPAAQRVMRTLDYQPYRPYDIDFTMEMHRHMPPYVRHNWPTVELHWTIEDPQNPRNIDLDGLWQRSEQVMVSGAPARVLSISDLVQHISLHAVHHHRLQSDLRPLVDIQAVLEKHAGDLDWEALASSALAAHTARPTALFLRLARDLLGAPVPEHALARLNAPDMDTALYQSVQRMLFAEQSPHPEVTPDLAELIQRGGLLRKLRILLGRIFISRRVMALIYPVSPRSPKILLYYSVRLAYLLRTYSSVLWARMRRSPAALMSVERQSALNEEEKLLAEWLETAPDGGGQRQV